MKLNKISIFILLTVKIVSIHFVIFHCAKVLAKDQIANMTVLLRSDGTTISPVPENLELKEGDRFANKSSESIKVKLKGLAVQVQSNTSFVVKTMTGTEVNMNSVPQQVIVIEHGSIQVNLIVSASSADNSIFVMTPSGKVQLNSSEGQQTVVSVQPDQKSTSVKILQGSAQIISGNGDVNYIQSGKQLVFHESDSRSTASPGGSRASSVPSLNLPPPPKLELENHQEVFEAVSGRGPISIASPIPVIEHPVITPVITVGNTASLQINIQQTN